MIKRFFILSLSMLALAPSIAKKTDNVLSQTITDEAIVWPESFETDTQRLLEGWYMQNYTATDNAYTTKEDVKVSDEEMIRRLAAMPCVIDMPYNQIVRQYIERYTKNGRPQVSAILGLGIYYFPIFEQALEAEGLPLELKYLPVIESSLDPNAVSKSGAAGLWQFMIGAAKGYNMEVNSLVDERRDPYTSSQKAAKLLKDLYSTYKDWSLAIAAYNCGPGTVNKAIRRAGGDPSKQDFWSIYYYLPQETRGYVPMFIAANYVMNYYGKHNISPVLPTKPLVTDTIGVPKRVHFDQISSVLNIPKDELRVLNPQFRADLIPGTPEKPYFLILPSQQVHAYIMSEDQILAFNADQYAQRLTAQPGGEPDSAVEQEVFNPADNLVAEEPATAPAPTKKETPAPATTGAKHTVTHTVAAGESLADIAEFYQVTATDIRHLNGLRRNAVRPGQQIRVETTLTDAAIAAKKSPAKTTAPAVAQNQTKTAPAAPVATPAPAVQVKQTPAAQPTPVANSTSAVDKKKAAAAKKKADAAKKKKAAQPTSYSAKEGDNLSHIAKRHGVSVEELKKANPGKGDMIHPGDKITIPAKKSAANTSSKKKSKKKKR